MSGIANWKAKIELDIKDLQKQLISADEKIDKFANEDRKIKLDVDTKTLESAIQKLDKMLDSLGKGTDDFKQFEHLSKELSSIVSEVQSLSKAFGKVDDSGTKTLLSSIQNIDKSLSELSQNILNVNKNMSNMGIKQIENISNAYGDATKNAEKLAEIQNKLNNKSNSSSNNIVGTMLPSDSEFKTVLSNLDTAKSKLGEIVKITEKINSDGKKSYVLRDKNGSTETYNINSKTQKGQIQSSNYVQYDANAIIKEKKEELTIEQEITKEHEKQVSTQQKKWQSFQREQQQYLSNQNENEAVKRNQKVYQELTDAIQRYSDVSKRVAGNNVLDGDLEEIQNLENKISKLQKEPLLSKSQVEKSERDLIKLYDKLDDLERKVQQTNNNKIVSNTDKSTKSEWDKNEKTIQDYVDAVTKLNNLRASDKGTGKKLYEIAGQMEEIEKLKKEAYEARQVLSSMVNPHSGDIDTWNKWLEVMNKFDQASLGSAESVNRLKDSLKNALNSELNSLQNSIDKYQKIITQAKIYPSDFHPSTEYNTKLTKLESTNEALKNYKVSLQGATELTKKQQAEINKLTQDCEKAATEFKKLSAAEKGTVEVGIEKAIQRINKDLAENTKYSAEAKAGLNALLTQLTSGDPSINLRKITEEMIRIENAEIAAGRAGKSFFDIFKEKSFYGFIGQMQSFLSMYVGFYGMINAARNAFETKREFDTSLTEMEKVSNETIQSLKNYQITTFDVADAVGTTAKQVQESTADYMRLGESLDEASESAKTANVLMNVSEFDNIEDATKSLVAMGQAYKDLDKMTIVDKLNEVGNNYAISTDELATALQKSSATLSLMGNTIDEAASLVTTANATIQDADSVSAGLRTISLRLVGTEEAEKELSTMNEEVDAFVKATNSKKQQIIKDYTAVASNNYQGFDILDSNGNYKNTYQILLGIAKVYKEIQEQDKKLGTNHATALIEELAGKNRSNIASAILQDPTQLEAVKKSSENSKDSAKEELNKFLDSIDGKMLQLENRASQFWDTFIESDTIKNGISLVTTLIEGVTKLVDTAHTLPALATAITGILSIKDGRGKLTVMFQ